MGEVHADAGLELRQLPDNVIPVLLTEPAKRTDAQKRELTAYYAKTDTKLTALLVRSSKNSLLGRLTELTGETVF